MLLSPEGEVGTVQWLVLGGVRLGANATFLCIGVREGKVKETPWHREQKVVRFVIVLG